MMQFQWRDADHDTHYFYNQEDGRIVAQIHTITNTKVWLVKIIENYNEEHFLGRYISQEFAKRAVERYWEIQSRTLLE